MSKFIQKIKSQFSNPNQISIFNDKEYTLLKIIIWSFIGAWYLGFADPLLAAEFRTDHNITYTVDTSNQTHISHQITLTNLTPNHYATDYTLNVDTSRILEPRVFDSQNRPLEAKTHPTGVKTFFDEQLVGKGQSRNFTIEYNTSDIAQKVGRLWKVEIPAFSSSSQNTELGDYSITLDVPDSFAPLHYSSPEIVKQERAIASESLTFTSNVKTPTPITAVFGDYQVYDFTLKYQINPIQNNQTTRKLAAITLPPNFPPYQEIYVKSLDPLPEKIEKDADGNILASYKTPQDNPVNITYTGQIKIDNTALSAAIPTNHLATQPSNHTSFLLPDKYWESNHPEIAKLAADLQTPRAIYNYVTENLSYDRSRIETSGDRITRYGAVQALQHKDNAVCTEFTDLTIALLRAANIPAREVNGYAYVADQQETDKQRPTISDVLHAWVMFYDDNAGVWRQIDPTWGNTARRDYFAALDTNHIILTIKGLSSEGPNPTNDVKITPAETIINDVVKFDDWLENFNYQKLPWYKKLLLWLNNLFNNK